MSLEKKYLGYLDLILSYVVAMEDYAKICNMILGQLDKEKEIKEESILIWILGIPGFILGTLYFPIVGSIIGLFIGVAIATIISLLYKAIIPWNRAARKAKKFHKNEVEPYERKLDKVEQEISVLIESPEFIEMEKDLPEAYRNIEALTYFVDCARKKLGNTDDEIYNLYNIHLKQEGQIGAQSTLSDSLQRLMLSQKQKLQSSKDIEETLSIVWETQRKISRQVKYGNIVNTSFFTEARNTRKNTKETKRK